MPYASALVFTITGLMVISGCASSRSTLLHRGEANCGWEKLRHLPGIPITVKVTTHLRVTVYEHHFHRMAAAKPESFWIDLGVPIRSIEITPVKTDKIFTVDSRRPGAGTLTSNITFDGQYFDDVTYNVEDRTIADVAELVKQVAPMGLFGVATKGSEMPMFDADGGEINEVKTVVACRLLELDSPTLESDIRAFLSCHFNQDSLPPCLSSRPPESEWLAAKNPGEVPKTPTAHNFAGD